MDRRVKPCDDRVIGGAENWKPAFSASSFASSKSAATNLSSVITGLDPVIHADFYRVMKRYWVYMLASRKNGTLYTGVTNDLMRRIHEHQTGRGSKFATRYGALRLVWYDEHPSAGLAIAREKAIKSWPRKWKIDLIEMLNPDWYDLKRFLNS